MLETEKPAESLESVLSQIITRPLRDRLTQKSLIIHPSIRFQNAVPISSWWYIFNCKWSKPLTWYSSRHMSASKISSWFPGLHDFRIRSSKPVFESTVDHRYSLLDQPKIVACSRKSLTDLKFSTRVHSPHNSLHGCFRMGSPMILKGVTPNVRGGSIFDPTAKVGYIHPPSGASKYWTNSCAHTYACLWISFQNTTGGCRKSAQNYGSTAFWGIK